MSVINRSVLINAPVRKVFEFVTSPENWTRYVTSLVEVRNLSADTPMKQSTFSWTYRMMGVKFSGKGSVTEYVKNKRFGLNLKGKADINEHYEFSDAGDGATKLNVKIEYEMPGEILKFIANSKLVEKLNNLEAKNVLEKVKAMCEGA
jgi:uncharacterized membrane protein